MSLLTRSEKRKDRVEIGPEQLILAAVEAEVILHIHVPVTSSSHGVLIFPLPVMAFLNFS